jgi:hypothetical protein
MGPATTGTYTRAMVDGWSPPSRRHGAGLGTSSFIVRFQKMFSEFKNLSQFKKDQSFTKKIISLLQKKRSVFYPKKISVFILQKKISL